jgi:chromosomal replication initiator protein
MYFNTNPQYAIIMNNNCKPSKVIRVCAEYYGVTIQQVLSKERTRKNGIIPARHMSILIMRQQLCMELKPIAKAIRRKDHSTISSALNTMKDLLDVYDDVRTDRSRILEKLKLQ